MYQALNLSPGYEAMHYFDSDENTSWIKIVIVDSADMILLMELTVNGILADHALLIIYRWSFSQRFAARVFKKTSFSVHSI